MSQILKFARNVPAMANDVPHFVTYAHARRDIGLPDGPQLYRSEAVGEDLAELYPVLSFEPQPRRRHVARAALGAAWLASLVMATVVVIHSTLA